jgi:uncharacterized membrane protein YdjX (TVP38/TMEM64 family)
MALTFWLTFALVVQIIMRVNNLTLQDVLDGMTYIFTDTRYGPLLYILSYTFRPLTLIPGTPFTLLGGYLYGVWPGGLYALLGGMLSSLLPYLAGRWFGDEDALQRRIQNNEGLLWQTIDLVKRNPLQTTVTLRMMYLPYDTVNFILGTLRIGFVAYWAGTFIGNAIPTFAGAGVGASVEGDLLSGSVQINPTILILSLLVWVVTFVISRYWYQWRSDDATGTDDSRPSDAASSGTHYLK